MTGALCPYCHLPGLVTKMKVHGNQLDVHGYCETCGYTYDSDYAPAEVADDLPGEFTRSLEVMAAD